MSQFEFISVAVSMVMALGVSRLLDVIAPALRPLRRSWIHVGWVVQKFFNHVFLWWALWIARDSEWNLAYFVANLASPTILYLQAAALATPSEASPNSWEDRFFEIRVPFFLGNLGIVLVTLILSQLVEAPTESLVVLAILGGLSAAGLATRNVFIHHVIVGAALLLQLLGVGAALFELSSPSM